MTVEYKVDAGVPMPPLSLAKILRLLRPGDSFLVPLGGRELSKVRNHASRDMARARGTSAKRFTLRARNYEQHGEEGVRIWRIPDDDGERIRPSRPEEVPSGAADPRPTPEPLG